jgi:methylmalonyl-CoA mutase
VNNKPKLFSDFKTVTSKQWKQLIQYDLKGADYNETLVWESPEGIKVKPFYHSDEEIMANDFSQTSEAFQILQPIFVHNVNLSNKRASETISRGAESIAFTIENEDCSISDLMENLPKEKVRYFFYLQFLSIDFVSKVEQFTVANNYDIKVQIDPINHLVSDGNWRKNETEDFKWSKDILAKNNNTQCHVDARIYQNAGANKTQEIAFAIGQAFEYLNAGFVFKNPIVFQISTGSNYFFEIAKLRALRLVYATIARAFGTNETCEIIATPSKRNKTIYDYNINMLRTTTECMSAILGGANFVCNLAYDAIYHKDNEFGDRISRNQLLILKKESYFDQVKNPSDGTYYIESLTNQLAEKALQLFKEIEEKGGFISQLKEGLIQKKIQEAAKKEQELFDSESEILVGTNKFRNETERMSHDLELYPFVKQNPRKTLIIPIIEKRLAENLEKERLSQENQS